METRFQDNEDDSSELSCWECVASLIFAIGCLTLTTLSLIDVVELGSAHPSLTEELPFWKILTLVFVAFFMGLCAFVNVVIFYANIKDVFIGIYNLIFTPQTYKFRK